MRFVVIGRHTGVEVIRLVDQLGLTGLSPAAMLHRFYQERPLLSPGSQDTLSVQQPVTRTLLRSVVSESLSAPWVPDRWILAGFPRTIEDARWLSTLLERQGTPVTAALIADAPRGDAGEHAALVSFYGAVALPLGGFLL